MRSKITRSVFREIAAIRAQVRVREPGEFLLKRAVRKGVAVRWHLDQIVDPIKIGLFRELGQCVRR